MKSSLIIGLAGALLLTLSSVAANAQAAKTWVSGVGNDANPCTRAQPCATFDHALGQTMAGGEIDVLDPGDFGFAFITKAISIINDGAGDAGILRNGAMQIEAGISDVVYLRGLVLNGTGTGGNGIIVNNAQSVTIENCVIQGYNAGIEVLNQNSMTLKIHDNTITNNQIGVFLQPAGTGILYASIDHSRIDNNGTGVVLRGNTGNIFAGVSESSMSMNAQNGLLLQSGPASVNANVFQDAFVANGQIGVKADQSFGGNATALVGQSMFADDGGGAVAGVAGGSVLTLQNNQVTGAPGNFTKKSAPF